MRNILFGLLSVTVLLLGCSGDETETDNSGETFQVRGSVDQVHVWRAPPNANVELVDSNGDVAQTAVTDGLGSIIFRDVAPGDGYTVRFPGDGEAAAPGAVRVLDAPGSYPDQAFYTSQKLEPGYTYITTRDGTKLAAYITLPGPIEDGPYPTVIDYSGYAPAKPGGPIGNYKSLCGALPALCDAPNDPSGFTAALVGFATVSVNMRGTGCSGGAYDFFEDLQLLDGYDIVETVAAQEWVKGHKVGMVGLSFPGISQLFVARTHPPSLAAITPLSVIGNTYTTARPGGMFNDGFALEWISSVLDQAAPYGQGWEQARVDEGDKICEENQLLHDQRQNNIEQARQTPYYSDEVVAPLDPSAFVSEIDVPVFLAGAWQDEQTGPFFFSLLDKFDSAPVKRFLTYNGVHPDGFAPQVVVEMKAFLDLYVAEEITGIDENVRTLSPFFYQDVYGAPLQFPPDPLAEYTSFEEAKAAYEAGPQVMTIFESGAGDNPGAPEGAFTKSFESWPPSVDPVRFYFQSDGSLAIAPPSEMTGASSFDLDPDAGHRTILPGGHDVMELFPPYEWPQPKAGAAVVFESQPLASDLVMVGTGSVDIWLRSEVDDADIEVNLSEVRPDGQEMFIQSGWLRASLRALSKGATELWPEPTFRQEDEALLVPGEWTLVRVGITAFSHVFRPGSRIRIAIDTPGDSRARWQFALKELPGQVRYDVGHSSLYPSSVVLPVLPGEVAPTALPACPSLRGQQCRDHVLYTNAPANP